MKLRPYRFMLALQLSCVCGLTLCMMGADAPVVNTADELPPLGGPGWYSTGGQSVRFYVEYGTNQGLPAASAFTGVFLEAHDMIVDNFQNVTRSYTNNDEHIRFNAQLTGTITTLYGMPLENPMLVTLAGTMQVRLANRVGHSTGTFPLAVEALQFVLTQADIGGTTNTPLVGIRISPTIPSTGELTVRSLTGGGYEVSSTLTIHSEAAMYYATEGRWLPYWPDQNVPTTYSLNRLKAPSPTTLTFAGTASKDVQIQFPMRRYLRCELLHSADLGIWTPLCTNQWTLGNGDFSFTHPGGGSSSKGFYMIRPSLLPAP